MKYEDMELDESMERALFAARARVDETPAPPVEAVLAAIDAPAKPRARRAVAATFAAAASVAAIFGALHALTPERERIVSDRGDASAPSQEITVDPRMLYSNAAGATTCEMDRTIVDPADFGACTMEATCSIAGP